MEVGNDYKLESDPLNITLLEKKQSKKDGSEYWKTTGYFSSPKEALKFLVDLGVRESLLKDLKTVVEKQAELYKLIEEFFDTYEVEEPTESMTVHTKEVKGNDK